MIPGFHLQPLLQAGLSLQGIAFQRRAIDLTRRGRQFLAKPWTRSGSALSTDFRLAVLRSVHFGLMSGAAQ